MKTLFKFFICKVLIVIVASNSFAQGDCDIIKMVGRKGDLYLYKDCRGKTITAKYKPDQQAKFIGGWDALVKYVYKNLDAPTEKDGGIVEVLVLVDKDGSVLFSSIHEGMGKPYDQLALNLVNKMPKLQPAKHKGKNIRSVVVLEIPFAS
ncbi:MAG: energy transducer TonB [Hyphomicrobiales bacterium]